MELEISILYNATARAIFRVRWVGGLLRFGAGYGPRIWRPLFIVITLTGSYSRGKGVARDWNYAPGTGDLLSTLYYEL